MSEHKNKNNILSCVKPLLCLSKISAGFSLFTIRDNFNVHVSVVDNLLILSQTTSTVLLSFIYFNTVFGTEEIKSEILEKFFPSITFAAFIIFTFMKFLNFKHRNSIVTFLLLLNEIDEDLEVLGVKFDYECQRKSVLKFIFVIIYHHAVIVLLLAITAYYYQIYFHGCFLVFWCFHTSIVCITMFLCSVFGLRERFKAFNETLLLNTPTKSILKDLSRIHIKFIDIVNLINKTQSMSIMFSLCLGFAFTSIFIFIMSILSLSYWRKYFIHGLLHCWLNLFMFGLIVTIFKACESTIEQRNKSLNILMKFLINSNQNSTTTAELDKKANAKVFKT